MASSVSASLRMPGLRFPIACLLCAHLSCSCTLSIAYTCLCSEDREDFELRGDASYRAGRSSGPSRIRSRSPRRPQRG